MPDYGVCYNRSHNIQNGPTDLTIFKMVHAVLGSVAHNFDVSIFSSLRW